MRRNVASLGPVLDVLGHLEAFPVKAGGLGRQTRLTRPFGLHHEVFVGPGML